MRVLLTAIFLLVLVPGASRAQVLANFGSLNFVINLDTTTAPFAQGDTTLTLNGPFGFGSTLDGKFSGDPYDWSGISNFGLLMSAPGASPGSAFTFYMLDSLDAIIGAYTGSASGLTSTPSVVELELNDLIPGTGDFSDVKSVFFTWESAGTSAVTMNAIVPEPSTWALLSLAAAFGGLAWHRRSVASRRG